MASSSIEHGGYQHILQFYGSVGPLECIFMALLTLSNAGAPARFFHLMEAPTMRLPNVKILICWPSRMQIYGFVENHTFLEQFVSMGVPAQFSNLGVPAHFGALVWYMSYCAIFWIIRLHWLFICMVTIRYKSMGGKPPASSESRPLVIERSE